MEVPTEIRPFCNDHDFVPTEEMPGGHCSRVFANERWVLKLPFQGEELVSGLLATKRLAKAGGPQVIAITQNPPAVLMERLKPGSHLAESPDSEDQRLEIFLGISDAIGKLPSEGVMPIQSFFEDGPPMSTRCRELLSSLVRTTQHNIFLHGDLHHQNILWDGERWRPIDPKGLVGGPHFEPVAYLRNPLDLLPLIEDLEDFTRRRLLRVAEKTGLSPNRIVGWALLDRLSIGKDETIDAWIRLGKVYEALHQEFPIEAIQYDN